MVERTEQPASPLSTLIFVQTPSGSVRETREPNERTRAEDPRAVVANGGVVGATTGRARDHSPGPVPRGGGAQACSGAGVRRPRIERAFGKLLLSQAALRRSTAELRWSGARVQLEDIVRGQLDHLDELIGRVARYLNVSVVAPMPPDASTTLGVAILVEHAVLAAELRALEGMCASLDETRLERFVNDLGSEHATLAAGLSRLVERQGASAEGLALA